MAVFSPQNTIGPGNVISGNLRGVLISGATATGNLVVRQPDRHRLAAARSTWATLAEGILIEDATDNIIQGDAKGSQVISGNLVGVVDRRATSTTRNLVAGQPDRHRRDRA